MGQNIMMCHGDPLGEVVCHRDPLGGVVSVAIMGPTKIL